VGILSVARLAPPDEAEGLRISVVLSRDRTLSGGEDMLATIAAVLIVLWLLGFFAFHVTSGLIHVVLVVGLIVLVLHFLRGR
jgi:hypothetical protein